MPKDGRKYYFPFCGVNESQWDGGTTDTNRLNSVGVYPTKAIAEDAKAHADWWREFDLIWDKAPGDKPNGESGCGYVTYKTPDFNIGKESIERLGGEQKVIDMLTRGRVFRFKWGGE